MLISRKVIPKLTKHFAEKGNINAVLFRSDKTIKKKLSDLKVIISFLSEVKNIEFVILKMQPMITHLGNDVDVLIRAKDVKPFLRELGKGFQISHVELNDNTRRGFKATIYLSNMELSKIDLYTYLGWIGYFFASSDELIESRRTAIFAFNNASFPVPVLPNSYALMVDILHSVFGNGYISLGDIIKLLLYLEAGFANDAKENPLLSRREIVIAMNCFLKSLKMCLVDVLSLGRCYIPLRYFLPCYIISSSKNFFINKELSPDIYRKELGNFLERICKELRYSF